jgi:hypothetical protein|tara:strand:+ start:328 stop:513 length:186 start_codon:yes stop_codon:yes gene_type:complete
MNENDLIEQRKKYDKAFEKWNEDMLEWEYDKKEKRKAYIKSQKKDPNATRNPNRTDIYDKL